VFIKLWSVGSFGRKNIAKIVSDTERIKNTATHVCAKTAFVGWPSTESRQISSFHNFLPFNRLQTSGKYMYHLFLQSVSLHVVLVLYDSPCKRRLFS
jgi:hypothetical protein